MINFYLKFRWNLITMFGMLAKTSNIEKKENQLIDEFNKFNDFAASKKLADFKELEEFVTSKGFKQIIKKINSQKFKNTEAYQKLLQYKKLKSSKKIKTYYKIRGSDKLVKFKPIETSDALKQYEALKTFVLSEEFKNLKSNLAQKKKEEIAKLSQYKKSKNSSRIKNYFNIHNSKELQNYKAFKDSKDLQDFIKLKEFSTSDQYKNAKSTLKKIEFKRSEEYRRFKIFKKLLRSKKIKNFFKFGNSQKLKKYNETVGTAELKNFEDLEKYIQSGERKKYLQTLIYKNREEYKKYKGYNKLKKSKNILFYFKFKNSGAYKIFLKMDNSEVIQVYENLKKYIHSKEFEDIREYMKIKNKFKLSEEYKKQQEYKQLKKSREFTWFFKLCKSNKFDELKRWQLTFEDNFDSKELDASKWLTKYYWGDKLMNASYAQTNDLHFFTDGKNIEAKNSILKILTKKENTEGKAWHPTYGFYPKKFEYTSGTINTGKSFRQKYGRFQAKVKINQAKAVNHTFWMVSEQILPHVDVFKFNRKKLFMNHFWGNITERKGLKRKEKVVKGVNFTKNYYIFTLEWTAGKLLWKINNTPVRIAKKGIPQSPMYLNFSSGVNGVIDVNKLPVAMEIDWVKCFQLKEGV